MLKIFCINSLKTNGVAVTIKEEYEWKEDAPWTKFRLRMYEA